MTDTKPGIIDEGWTFVWLYSSPVVIFVLIRGADFVIEDGLGQEMWRSRSAVELGAELRRLGLDPRPAFAALAELRRLGLDPRPGFAALAELQLDPEIERLYMDHRGEEMRAAWGPYQYKRVLDRLFRDDGSEPDGG